ncbi:MAG: helix-turn-helix domain-containing protein [Defluviitaleaceae bacterium]|nr:helix-turn-helix domain-containing protein [Defluviitaleaceae bacterium]
MKRETKEHLKYIGENIRAARKSKNLTIDTLSELVGISPSFLGTLERGESSLSVETLMSICRTLGVSSDSIILNQDPTPMPVVVADMKDVIMTLLNNATEGELSFLVDYVKFYRGRVDFKDSGS